MKLVKQLHKQISVLHLKYFNNKHKFNLKTIRTLSNWASDHALARLDNALLTINFWRYIITSQSNKRVTVSKPAIKGGGTGGGKATIQYTMVTNINVQNTSLLSRHWHTD